MKKIILGVVFAFFGFLLFDNFALAADNYVKDEIIVKFKDSKKLGKAGIASMAKGYNAKVKRTDKSADFTVFKLNKKTKVKKAVKYFKSLKEVKYAEPNYINYALWSPNDQFFSTQWHFQTIGLPEAWDYDTTLPLHGGDPSVVVAVVDTGVAFENRDIYSKAPDFTGNSPAFTAGYNFVSNNAHPNDDNGHGTHVASTIAESTDNTVGVAGIAFNSTIMPVKVLGANGSGDDAMTASGISWAKDHGASIINMSLGSTAYSQTVADAVSSAANAGVVMVAAAGNGGGDGVGDPELNYPAKYSQVISVGATRYHNNQRATYSNYGAGLDLVAPGGQTDEGYAKGFYGWGFGTSTFADFSTCVVNVGWFIFPTSPLNSRWCSGDGIVQQSFYGFFEPDNYPNNITDFNYWPINGTSQATPHVAGTAALLKAYGVPNNNIRSIVDNSATDLGTSGYDTEYGHGLLNAANAFTFPTIKSLSASSGSNSSNTNITVTGSNFVAGATMAIGSTALTNVNVVNATTITATVPKHLAGGVYDLSATSSGKTTSATGVFTVVDTAPSEVANLRVVTSNGKVSFKWKNPTEWDFSKVKILRKNKSFPANSSDGKVVFNKKKTSFINKNLSSGKKYYYKIFTYDTSGNYSSGVPVVVIAKGNSLVAENSNNYAVSGDVNSDGQDEIIVGAKAGRDPKIYITDKSGKKLFKKSGFYPFGSGARSCGINVAAGDLNNDGKDEIIAAKGGSCKSLIKVFNKSGKKLFKKSGFKPFKSSGAVVAAGDLDGDNIDEIIVGAARGKAKIYTYKLSSNNFVKVFKTKGWSAFSGNPGLRVFSGDVNYDGKDEILALRNSGSQEIRVFKYNGKKKFKNVGFAPYGSNYKNYMRVAVGDVNNDGYAEILTAFLANSRVDAWSYKGQKSVPKIKNTYLIKGSKEFVVGRFR